MILRRPASLLLPFLALPVVLSLAACSTLDSITIQPGAGSVILTAVGQTAQFSAFGVSQTGEAIPTTSNITTSVGWSSSNPSVATINSAGIATAVGPGYSQILAQSGGQVATSDVTVAISGSTGSTGSTPSITVTPGSASDTFAGETTQFQATGNLTGTGNAQNLTNQVQWSSSNVQVATINATTGLAAAGVAGTTTITAQSGGIIGTAVLTVNTTTASSSPTITIIPGGATASFTGETTQFIALGNLAAGSGDPEHHQQRSLVLQRRVGGHHRPERPRHRGLCECKPPKAPTITAIGTTSAGSLISAISTLSVSSIGGTVILAHAGGLPKRNRLRHGDGCIVGSTSSSTCISPATINCGAATGASCSETFQLANIVRLRPLRQAVQCSEDGRPPAHRFSAVPRIQPRASRWSAPD